MKKSSSTFVRVLRASLYTINLQMTSIAARMALRTETRFAGKTWNEKNHLSGNATYQALGESLVPICSGRIYIYEDGGAYSERGPDMGTQAIPVEQPVTVLRQYINAFNKGDARAMAACFAIPGSILDGMVPHVWHGPTATQDWYRDVLVEGKQHGASDYFVTLGEPLHNNVTGDSAYVVVPATMTFKVHGKQITQSGAIFTTAFRRVEDGWRIAAWAWAKGTPVAS